MAHTRKIHLGERSLGRSSSGQELLSLRGTAPNLTTEFVAFEADDAQAWERLGNLAWVLADEAVPAYLEKSRRGGHLWLFLFVPHHLRIRQMSLGIVQTRPKE